MERFSGTAALGTIAIIVNETLRPRQIEHILHHARVRALVSSADQLARQPRPIETTAAVVTTDRIPASAALTPVERVGADAAEIIYTSGSTGPPKGVTLSHANLWAGVRAVSTYLGIGSDDRIASLLPFSFDYGFNQLLCAVASEATLVVERSPVPQQIAATLRSRSVTILPCVPPLWRQLLTTDVFRAAPLPSLRVMTNTGGRLPVEAVRALREAQPHRGPPGDPPDEQRQARPPGGTGIMIPPDLESLLRPFEEFAAIRRRAVRLGDRLCDLSYANPTRGWSGARGPCCGKPPTRSASSISSTARSAARH